MANDTIERLAVDILRCEVVERTLSGEATDCEKVVTWQGRHKRPRYCPEPWVGHLERAPILFISSNPGSDEQGALPSKTRSLSNEASDEELIRAATCAFDEGQWPGVASAVYLVDRQGAQYGRAVRYWSWAKRMARELLGREAIPGTDYALSEVVHCGSKKEWGVLEARAVCTQRYLRRLLALSPARVVIVVGGHARQSFAEEMRQPIELGHLVGPTDLVGRQRCVVPLPHPNAWGYRWGLAPSLGEQVAARILEFVR